MKPTKTLPFISMLLIAAMITAPFIFAFEGGFDSSFFTGGSYGGTDSSAFSGGSYGGQDPSAFSGGSFGGTDPSAFSGGSYGGTDPSAFSGGLYGGTDPSAFSGGSETGTGSTSGSITGGTTGGSFDGPGSIGFPGGDLPGGPAPGPGPGFPSEHDAVWQDLPDKTILRGSPSGTLIQENVFDKCTDPDSDTLFFEITSTSTHYELFFFANDIRIFFLDPGFVGSETAVVTCNGVPESFLLHVVERGASIQTLEDEDDRLSVHIGAIIIPNAYDAQAGDVVPVTISFKNNGDEKLENLKAAVAIPDLGVKASVGPMEDLPVGKRVSKTVYIELPEDAKEGMYYARITIDSGSLHRVKHRDVEVIVQ